MRKEPSPAKTAKDASRALHLLKEGDDRAYRDAVAHTAEGIRRLARPGGDPYVNQLRHSLAKTLSDVRHDRQAA